MQFTLTIISSVLLVSGIRGEAEPLSTSTLYKEGHHGGDYLQSFHHGQHHAGPSEVGSTSGVGHPVGLSPQIQDQSLSQDQVAHPSVGQVNGQVGPLAPIGGQSVIPQYVGQKSDVPLHYGARAIGAPFPYLYGKTYASPYYAPYQQQAQAAGPYSGYYQAPSVYPYNHYNHYSPSPYAATPYSAPVYSSPVNYPGYGGYQGASGSYGYIPPYYPSGYSQYYQPSAEVQQSTKQ